jgi:hypothetical protein
MEVENEKVRRSSYFLPVAGIRFCSLRSARSNISNTNIAIFGNASPSHKYTFTDTHPYIANGHRNTAPNGYINSQTHKHKNISAYCHRPTLRDNHEFILCGGG